MHKQIHEHSLARAHSTKHVQPLYMRVCCSRRATPSRQLCDPIPPGTHQAIYVKQTTILNPATSFDRLALVKPLILPGNSDIIKTVLESFHTYKELPFALSLCMFQKNVRALDSRYPSVGSLCKAQCNCKSHCNWRCSCTRSTWIGTLRSTAKPTKEIHTIKDLPNIACDCLLKQSIIQSAI